MRSLALLLVVAACATAAPLQYATPQDTIVDLTPYFQGGLQDGHALLANLSIVLATPSTASPVATLNGKAVPLGTTATMEIDAVLTDLSANGKTMINAKVIVDTASYVATLDGVPQLHVQALIRAINRVSLGDVSAVSEVIISLDGNGNEMSRTQNEIALQDSVLITAADEPTTSDMFDIEVIIFTHSKSKGSPDSSTSSDSSDSSESSESSDSSDSSESSESSESAGGEWDDEWDRFGARVRSKLHHAFHKACSWFHRQPFYVKSAIGFGMTLVLFSLFYTCLRCLAAANKSPAPSSTTAPAFFTGKGKVYEYSEKNLDFPLDDITYETKPLMSYSSTDDVQRV